MIAKDQAPVLAIDGPTASGKGTVSANLARKLGFHYLDSGAIYRSLGLAALYQSLNPDAEKDFKRIEALAMHLDLQFEGKQVFLDGSDVGAEIRTEQVGEMASKLAVFPVLRQNLLERQRAFQKKPGLVADGRDMGSVVFPQATLKVFLTASVHVRAMRRHKQLTQMGKVSDYDKILADLKARDERDSQRVIAPLKPAEGAIVIDSSDLTADEVVEKIFKLCLDEQLVEK